MDTELVTTTLISTDIDTETHTLAIKCDEIEDFVEEAKYFEFMKRLSALQKDFEKEVDLISRQYGFQSFPQIFFDLKVLEEVDLTLEDIQI